MIGLLLLTTLAASDAPIELAAPGLTMVNVDPKLTLSYTSALAQQLTFKGVRVKTAADFAQLLGLERQQQLMGCPDDVCKAQVTEALGIDGLLVGSVTRFEKTWRLDAKVLGTGNGKPLAAASSTAADADALLQTFGLVADQLALQLAASLDRTLTADDSSEVTSWSTLKRLSLAPGALGVVALVGGGVGLGLASGSYARLTTGSTTTPLSLTERTATVSAGKTQQTLGWVGIGAGAACLAAAAVMFFAGGDETVSAGVAIGPGSASVGLAGVW